MSFRQMEPQNSSHRFLWTILSKNQVSYIIPESDITLDGLNYTESYQNGQRRSITVTLANENGQYTPNINGIWVNTRFGFDVGIQYQDTTIWFPKGVYSLGDGSLTREESNKTIQLQLADKYAVFEGKTGTLETAYEVELGSNIIDAVKGVLNFSLGMISS